VRHAYAKHHSKNWQANTYYLAVDAWCKHISLDKGIAQLPARFCIVCYTAQFSAYPPKLSSVKGVARQYNKINRGSANGDAFVN